MSYLGRFVKGGRRFDVSSSPYALGSTFTPPSANLSFVGSSGSSANRYGGTRFISDRANNFVLVVPVDITGTSIAKVRRARRELAAFLALGSDEEEPMYFEFRDDVPIANEPLFGQYGANQRMEIVHAAAPTLWENYGTADIRTVKDRHEIVLTCKPFILGKRQILGTATGGLYEDKVGTVDGFSKGLSIPKASTNDFPNSIFENDDFDNGWTIGSDLVVEATTDRRFVLFGNVAAKVLCNGATNRQFTDALTLLTGAYHLSVYAKLPDGGAVSASQITLVFDGAAVTAEAYTSVGDGWYRINYDSTVTAGSLTMGVQIVQGVTIYLDGFQIEYETSFVTTPFYGGLAGVASAATIYSSGVTRTAGTLTYPIDEIISQDEGTIRIVWDTRYAASGFVNRWFFADSNGTFEGFLNAAHQYRFTDGVNNAQGTANQPNNHEKLVLHFVYGGGEGLKIYLNGSEEASDTSYTVPATKATTLYVGSDETGAQQANGVFMEFSTYDVALSSTQVLADYTALSGILTDSKAINSIPFLWTKDGDNVVDNVDDSTRDNYAIAAGIPGTHPAETRIDGEISPGWTNSGLFLSNFIMNDFIRPGESLYGEQQGTADATASGGEYNSQTVTTGVTTWSTTLDNWDLERLFNKECYLFTRLYDAGSNLTIAFSMTGNSTIVTEYRAISTTTAFRLFKTDSITITNVSLDIPGAKSLYNSPAFALSAKRTVGSAAARVDFNILMPRPLLRLTPGATAAGSPEGFSYRSRDHEAISKKADDTALGFLEKRGDRIELVPIRYNGLVSIIGDIAQTNTITHTLTYERIYVTPRWSVI